MRFNMDDWSNEIITAKDRRFLPVIYFPCLQLTGMGVTETVHDGKKMAKVMKVTLEKFPTIIAAMTAMDLTADAEAFGAKVKFKDTEAPSLASHVVSNKAEAEALKVPDMHAARLGVFTEAVIEAKKIITDRPVFGGQLGPFSLAGNLLEVQSALKMTISAPETVDLILEKATDFLIHRALAYKDAGADGILLAEPTAGLLSPKQYDRFSAKHVKHLVDAVQDSYFYVILHNCGYVTKTFCQVCAANAKGLSLGNVVNMRELLARSPKDVLVMGNINPADIVTKTPDDLYTMSKALLESTAEFSNYIFSSGCDIPPTAPLENVKVIEKACVDFNREHGYV